MQDGEPVAAWGNSWGAGGNVAQLAAAELICDKPLSAEQIRGIHAHLRETYVDGKWYGRTRGDKLVFFESNDGCMGKLINIEITKTSPWALQGGISREILNGH